MLLAGAQRVGVQKAAAGRSSLLQPASVRASRRACVVVVRAGPERKVANGTADSPNKTLTREAEPEEFWAPKTAANPMADPVAVIGVAAIFFPFILLGLAVATGVIDVSVYK